MPTLTIFTSVLVVHMSRNFKAYMQSRPRPRLPVDRRTRGHDSQQKDTICHASALWILSLDLKHTEVSFLPNSIDSLCLRVAQMPRSREVVIFWTTLSDAMTDYFTPLRMRAG
jgi:hypothetical protein